MIVMKYAPAALVLAIATGALAQGVVPTVNTSNTPHNPTGIYSAVTVGTSASTILAASSPRYYLQIQNQSLGATVCISFGGTASISGNVCGAANLTIPPLGSGTWEQTTVPADAISAIASIASTPVTIGVK